MKSYDSAKALLGRLPRVTLGFFPTPLHKLDKLSAEYGVNIYLKRDDFSGISLFGGNKIRKLEFIFGDAIKIGCDTVFTYGATQSNHAMQTATAARKCGFNPVLYLVSLVEPSADDMRGNLLLDTILGAEIHIVPANGELLGAANQRSVTLAKERMGELEKAGHRCYDIPPGGANNIGSCAFIGGFMEMYKQMDVLGKHPDYIFTATGTGGTMAGLVAGKALLEIDTNIVGIIVGPKPDSYADQIALLATKALEYITANIQVGTDSFLIDRNYFAPGYEMPNEDANNAIKKLARTEGIFTDSVYSGKAFSGMLDYIKTGKVSQGSNVVFWHTGGTTALFAEHEIIGSLIKG
jgi:D-cysteine desulfhydrase family pyridoxal phosphate-dependent enzyme